ncbi:MAG: hypothetical protein KJ798_01850 [Gammaproteobacteria bacterium]|nr:hypothetical protein [Gammaproteobacteria bacterium]
MRCITFMARFSGLCHSRTATNCLKRLRHEYRKKYCCILTGATGGIGKAMVLELDMVWAWLLREKLRN